MYEFFKNVLCAQTAVIILSSAILSYNLSAKTEVKLLHFLSGSS